MHSQYIIIINVHDLLSDNLLTSHYACEIHHSTMWHYSKEKTRNFTQHTWLIVVFYKRFVVCSSKVTHTEIPFLAMSYNCQVMCKRSLNKFSLPILVMLMTLFCNHKQVVQIKTLINVHIFSFAVCILFTESHNSLLCLLFLDAPVSLTVEMLSA